MITTKNTTLVALALLLVLLSSYSHGYEVSTHAALVREAYNLSTLPDKQATGGSGSIIPGVLTRLGLNGSSNLGNVYLDMNSTSGAVIARLAQNMGD